MANMKMYVSALLIIAGAQAHALYPVHEAISDAVHDDLTLVGKWVPRYSEDGKMPMCVFRGEKVVVLSYYCTKKVVAAASIRIYSRNPAKGEVSIYVEAGQYDDVTKVRRDRYSDINMTVAAYDLPKAFKFKGSLKDFRKIDDAYSKDPGAACLVTKRFPKTCKPAHESELDSWGDPALAFWEHPSEDWYDLVKLLNSKVP